MIKLTRRNAKHSYVKGKRYHVTPIGELPGVTTILNATSGVNWFKWRKENPEKSKQCLDRGLALHDHVEFYFSDDPTLTLKADSLLFDKLYNSVLKHIKPIVIEHQVYSELGFSGSLDCLGYVGDCLTLFDWKTANQRKTPSQVTDYLIQIAAYSYALKELDGITVNQASVVIIPEEDDCQFFFLRRWDMIDAYFDEFKKRLRWFQSQS